MNKNDLKKLMLCGAFTCLSLSQAAVAHDNVAQEQIFASGCGGPSGCSHKNSPQNGRTPTEDEINQGQGTPTQGQGQGQGHSCAGQAQPRPYQG